MSQTFTASNAQSTADSIHLRLKHASRRFDGEVRPAKGQWLSHCQLWQLKITGETTRNMPTAGNKNDNLIWWHNQPKSTHPFWARYIFNVTLEVTSSCVWRNCLFQKMVRYLNLFPSNRRMMIRTTHWFEICLSMGMKHLFVGHTIPIHTPFSKGLRGAPAASSSASFLCSCLGRITPRNKWKVTCNYTCLYIYTYV